MRTRTLSLLAVLAIVVAACNGSGAENATTTSSTLAETTTTTPAPEAVQLSYALDPGTSYEYQVELDQTIEMSSTGETSALGASDDVPGRMSLEITGTTTFTHTVAEGPESGTYEITIAGDFSGMEFAGTVDGEPVESSEIPDMAQMEPVDVTVVVDEQGNLIPDDTTGLGEDLLGGLGGLNLLDQFGAGGGAGQFIGPPFSEDEVTVGDTWSETVDIPTMPDAEPITTQIDSEVVSTETIDGHDVFVIETTNSTSAIEFDLAEFLVGFMTSFVPEDMSEEERAELDALVEELRFAFSVDPQVAELTTWFDHGAGLARQAELTSDTHMVMDLNIPDETTGELAEFGMDMNISQNVIYRLTGTGSGA